MSFRTYHCTPQGAVTFEELLALISKSVGSNFSPILREAAREIKEELASVGLVISVPVHDEDIEILLNRETKHLLALRFSSFEESGLDMLEFSGGTKRQDIIEPLQKAIGVNIDKGSLLEAALFKTVQERLGKLSRNGKVLADRASREAIRRLYDDTLRQKMKTILSALHDHMLPLEAFKYLLKGNSTAMKKLFDDSRLFERSYGIRCKTCGSMQLVFPTRDKADDAMAHSKNYCAACKSEGTLAITEAYETIETARLAIQQGLWLESLASDVVSQVTEHIWTGQMVNSSELDVLSIYCDKIVLIECKDSSFGQNDLHAAAAKAEDVRADIVMIVVTRDLHPNVQASVDRYNQKGERTFRTIVNNSTKKIQSALKTSLEETRSNFINRWFSSGLGHDLFYQNYS